VLLARGGDATVVDGAERLTILDDVDVADRVAILAGSAAFVQPSRGAAAADSLLDALALGIPVVTTDLPAIVEIVTDAAVLVPAGDPAALAEAIRHLLEDASAAERTGLAGADRAKAFTWRDAAEKTWQLHADL